MTYRTLKGSVVNAVERVFATPSGWRGGLLRVTWLLLPFLVYWAVLRAFRPSSGLLSASITMEYSFAVSMGLLLWLAYGLPGFLGRVVSLTLTLALFSLPLLVLWAHAGVHANAAGGLLPIHDASQYYYDARRLLDGHLFGFSTRRPLFVGMLATLLEVTGQNLQVTLATFVAVNAVACFFLAQEIRASEGPIGAVILAVLLYHFYRFEGGPGTTLTESFGLPLGMIGFAVLWRGAREWRVRLLWLGLGLLGIALMVRPGAFFVLPALVLGGAWICRAQGQSSVRFVAGAVAAIFLSVGVSMAMGRLLADPASQWMPFPNFSYTLYGVVVGGKGWTQLRIDHPEAREGAEIYGLAWRAFRAHPMGLVLGGLEMWREYLPLREFHAFAFVRFRTNGEPAQLACYALSVLGVVSCIRRYREPNVFLLAMGVLGHLASIPFAPPVDAGLRVYAATVPVLAILPAVAGSDLVRRPRWLVGFPRRRSSAIMAGTVRRPASLPAGAAAAFGLALVALAIVGPLAIRMVRSPRVFDEFACQPGKQGVYVQVSPGSFLRIVEDRQSRRTRVPEIRAVVLRSTVSVAGVEKGMDPLGPGSMLMNAYDAKSGLPFWLIAPADLLPRAPGLVRACGSLSPRLYLGGIGLFHADSMETVALP